MFLVSRHFKSYSPICMSFHEWWIYDLRSFHSFWKNKLKKEETKQPQTVFIGNTVWEALLKAENISVFSPFQQLQSLALKYHLFFNHSISSAQTQKVFSHFYRLGVFKMGHLRKIPRSQIQKRFGKNWADFFYAIKNPEQANWPWQSYREEQVIQKNWSSDELITHIQPILENSILLLKNILQENPNISIQKIDIELSSFESEHDQYIDFCFPHEPLLKTNLSWLRRLIEERLQKVELFSPLSQMTLFLKPGESKHQIQLQLFQNQQEQMKWEDISKKLQMQGFDIFQPETQNSHFPELSWKKTTPHKETLYFSSRYELRPLIQYEPKPISTPLGKTYFVERIHGFDDQGRALKRDYFLYYFKRCWRWIFEDQNKNWFDQGIVE